MARKLDGRQHNGRQSQGLTEGQTLVRGPAALFEGFAKLSNRDGVPLAELWRRAGWAYLQAAGPEFSRGKK